MADKKFKKKKKKQDNKSSRQKKIDKSLRAQEDETSSCRPTWRTNRLPRTENNSRPDQEYSGRSPSRGPISTCLQGVVSRIAGTFGRGPMTRDHGPAARGCNGGQRRLNDCSSLSGESSHGRQASETLKHDEAAIGTLASTYKRDLYDAVQDLCKPKMYYSNDLPKMNISFSIEFHTGITSVLVEMYNNIPDFSLNGLLRKLIMPGAFAGCYFKLVSKRYRREKILAFIQRDKRRDTFLSNRSDSKKMILFFTKNTGSILQKPGSKGNFAIVKRNTEKTSLLYKTNKTRLTGNMLVTSNFMKRVNISGGMNPCLLSNMVRDTTRATQSELTSSILPSQSSTQSLSIRDTGLQFSFRRRKTTRLYSGPVSKAEPLSKSKDFVNILFKFKSTKQRFSIPINTFMNILGVIQKELIEMTEGAVTKALKFQKDNARPICEIDKRHVEITIKIPGLAPLQVSMLPISFVQNVLQKHCHNSLLPMLNKYEITPGKLMQNIGRALQFSTGTNLDRNLTFMGPAKQKQRPKLFPEEAILAVAKRFLQINNDTCQPNPNIGRAIKFNTGTNLHRNLTTVGPAKQKQRPVLIPEEAKLAVAEWFLEISNGTCEPNLALYLNLDDTEKVKSKDGEIEDNNSRENFKHGKPDTENINIKSKKETDIYDSTHFEFFGGERELNEMVNTDWECLDDENAELCELDLKYDSARYEFAGGAGEPEITDGMWLEDGRPGQGESEFKYDSTQYDFFESAPDEDWITDRASLSQESSELVNLEFIDEELEAQYSSNQYDFFGDAIDVNVIMNGEELGGEIGDIGELESNTDKPSNADIPDTESDTECSGMLQAGITPSGEFQVFNSSVPHHLGQVNVPFKDKEDLVFETDEEDEKVLLSSGGFGDVYLARMANTSEPVIVKKTKNMKFVEILKETRIQTYLMPGQYVPAIEGIIGGPGHSETMIIQQFCASGRTLYDVIQACHAETLTLFDVHWLKLAYKLAVCFDDMHRKGVLHNDIKTDNILVEIDPDDIHPYIIDFGMASFRKGGRLTAPSGCLDCSSYDDYLAPEVRKCQLSSPKSDIYSLGKVLYEIAYYFCDALGPLSVDMCSDVAEDRPCLKDVAHYIENIMVKKDLS